MITISQAAAELNVSTRWIQTLVKRGDLSAQRITARLFLVDLEQTRQAVETAAARGKGQPRKQEQEQTK